MSIIYWHFGRFSLDCFIFNYLFNTTYNKIILLNYYIYKQTYKMHYTVCLYILKTMHFIRLFIYIKNNAFYTFVFYKLKTKLKFLY
jgi:hypothetical protein